MIDTVLNARTWRDLGVDRLEIKSMRKSLHPDLNHDPRANDAFIRLNELFNGADLETRYATGYRRGGVVEWQPKNDFRDLHKNSLDVMSRLSKTDGDIFFPVVAEATLDSYSTTLGSGWYLIGDFDKLDGRSTVWIANRLLAAIIYAGNDIHGDINESNVLVHPEQHGLIIEGWQASVKSGSPLICKPTYAPTKYLNGAAADQQLSVAQAMAVLTKRTVGATLLEDYINEVRLAPEEPAVVFDKIAEIAKRLYGPKRFHKLDKPNTKEI